LFYFIAGLFYFTFAANFSGGITVENRANWMSNPQSQFRNSVWCSKH